MRRVESREAVEWLAPVALNGAELGELTGYFADLWPAEGWVLHAMYENPDLPADLTHDDMYRMELASGTREPLVVGNVNLDEGATVTGGDLGKSSAPPSPWRRLSWDDLGRRLDHDPFTDRRPPSIRSFPYSSWPVQILPPSEGSLDREQMIALLENLARATPGGDLARLYCFYCQMATRSPGLAETLLFEGPLSEVSRLYDDPTLDFSPSNIWPDGHQWLVTTDYDLWGTRVCGEVDLIDTLVGDRRLETVRMNVSWYPATSP